MFLAHEWTDRSKLAGAGLAFLCFSLVASSVYVTNDLLDLYSDRRHPTKQYRPFASSALPVPAGPPLIAALVVLGLWISFASLPRTFSYTLLVYLILTLLYSLWLKQKLLIDVLVLVALYGLRLLGGGYATNIVVSEWLLAFSSFFFLSLAFLKRYSELGNLRNGDPSLRPAGRGYQVSDLGVIETVGPTSGYLAVLVLALYISSEQVSELYVNTVGLWLLCPLLLYWITRVWFLARRGRLDEDPIVFALSDRVSLLTWLIAILIVWMATLGLGPHLG
jgi:4-hydroxybenzoate polyprenyltransferase